MKTRMLGRLTLLKIKFCSKLRKNRCMNFLNQARRPKRHLSPNSISESTNLLRIKPKPFKLPKLNRQ